MTGYIVDVDDHFDLCFFGKLTGFHKCFINNKLLVNDAYDEKPIQEVANFNLICTI